MSVEVVPLVSCVMAVNRDDGFLDEAIESILNQTFSDFEFIIVANACSDELWAKLKGYSDTRIRLFRTYIGQLPFNLNFAINESRGKFIARMDADDISLPQRFEKQVHFLLSRPEVSVLGTAVETIDDKNRTQGIEAMPLNHAELAREMVWRCCIIHPSVMYTRESIVRSRGYAFTLFGEDYELWLRMLRQKTGEFANLPDVLLKYRVHGNQSTSSDKLKNNHAEMSGLLFREFLLTKRIVFLFSIVKRFLGQVSFAKLILHYPYQVIKK